jgi:hypothetical protein
MRSRNVTFAFIGAGVALALAGAPNALAQVVDYDQYNHLECYQIKDVKDSNLNSLDVESLDQSMLPPETFLKSCTFKRYSREYCVAARTQNEAPVPQADGDASTNGAVPTAFDYICYNVRCTQNDQPGRGTTTTIKDRFGQRDVVVVKMKKLCMPMIGK